MSKNKINYNSLKTHRFLIIVVLLASAILYGFSYEGHLKDRATNPIVERVSSDLQGITISITYDTLFAYDAYNVLQGPDTNKNAATNKINTNKALIHFPCTGESVDKFIIPQNQISAVIKTKYNLGVYDRTDFVFTEDSLYIVNTTRGDGKLFTSNVYVLPSLDSKYEFQSFLSDGNTGCGMNKKLFYRVLDFCSKYDIKY